LRKAQSLDAMFDPIIVSAVFGSGKESAAVFESALTHCGIRPDESVFIDNTPSNLIAPSALGMKVIFHDDEENDIDKLIATLTDELKVRLN
jgi:HAD superfamily hydrolase (TIGR01509 family)